MAYLSNPLDDELQKQKAAQGLNTSGVIDGTTGANAGAPTGGPVVDTKAPTSSGFVNLQQYLDANKGEGARLASDATKDLSSSADTYKTQATTAVDTAKKDFAGSTGDAAAARINQGITGNNNSVYSDASKFLGTGYAGPEAQDYTSTLSADAGRLKDNLGKVDDVSNQQALLTDAYGKNGNYTSGFKALDSFLIGGDQGGRDTIAAVKAKAGDVGTAYDAASTEINAARDAAKAKLDANKQSIRDNAKAAVTNKVNYVQSEIDKKNAGLNRDYLGTHAATFGDVLTDQSRMDLQALAQLAGEQADGRWTESAAYNAGHVRPVAPPPPAPEPNVVTEARNGTFNPFGPASAVPGAVATAGNNVAQAPKQNQAEPVNIAPSNIVENIVNKAGSVIPVAPPKKIPNLKPKTPKYKGPH